MFLEAPEIHFEPVSKRLKRLKIVKTTSPDDGKPNFKGVKHKNALFRPNIKSFFSSPAKKRNFKYVIKLFRRWD